MSSAARMRRVAWSPSSSGMRMSIRTTVGSKRAALSTASSPLLASATTSMSSSPASSMRKPARTIDWSSATSTRIVIADSSLEWEARAEDEPAPGRRSCAHLTAVDLDALADADEPVPEAVGRRAAQTVVAYLDLELIRPVADGHVRVAGARVLEGVGQALLNDAVGREVDPPRERERLAVDMQLDGQTGAADLVQQESRPSRPGWGTSSTSSPSRRMAARSRRISASAVRPAARRL